MVLLAAALSVAIPSNLQCNAVTARGETLPLVLSLVTSDQPSTGPATNLTTADARLSFSNVRQNMRHGNSVGLVFDVTIDGRNYRGELGRGFLGRDNSTLNVFEVDGDARGTPYLIGICGELAGYAPVPRTTHADVADDLSSNYCLAVTYGGRSFRYRWRYDGDRSVIVNSPEVPEWANQDARSTRMSPPLPNDGDIYRGFAALDAAPNTNGFTGSQFLYVNTVTLKGITFFDVARFSADGGIEQMGRAHCGVDQMARA